MKVRTTTMAPDEEINATCIVRLYRRFTDNAQNIIGVVEFTITEQRKGFKNKEELRAILDEYCAKASSSRNLKEH
jgi:hypothetical protein